MRAQEIAIFLLLLGHSQADSPPSQPPPNEGGFLARLSGVAKGAVDNVFHKVDVNHVYKAVAEDIKAKVGDSSCIAGLYVDDGHSEKTLKLVKGKMSDLSHMTMSGKTTNIKGDIATAKVTFTFHKIPLKYNFDYNTRRLLVKVDRHGYVTLQQEGAVNVEFTVELPKTQTKVQDLLKQNKCVANIRGVQTTIKSSSKLVTTKVDYKSLGATIGWKVTEGQVKKMLIGLKEDLENNIKAAAQKLIEPLFRAHRVNCKDATYTEPVGASAKRATDCSYFNTAKKYKRQP